MRRPKVRRHVRDEATAPATHHAIWWLVVATLYAVSFITADGKDVFHLPKLVTLEGAAILLLAGAAVVSILDPRRGILQRLRMHRVALFIALMAVTWTAITAAASTQRMLSLDTLLWVACCAAFFLVTVALAQERSLMACALGIVPALINAATVTAQRLEMWNPFVFPDETPIRIRSTAYIGNPDDVGSYLLIPEIAAIVLAIVHRGMARIAYAAAALLILVGMAASETLTASLALIIAGAVLLFSLSRRAALVIALASALALGLGFVLDLPILRRAPVVLSHVMAGRFGEAVSNRLQGFTAAWVMFKERPMVGVGPGCFAYWYLPYNMLLSGKHPEFLVTDQNFHDVHNDHLQLLATTGLPGYAIFLAALWHLGSRGRGAGAAADERQRFARLFARPAAAGFAVMSLGQFPLELAAATTTMLFFAALAIAWSRPS